VLSASTRRCSLREEASLLGRLRVEFGRCFGFDAQGALQTALISSSLSTRSVIRWLEARHATADRREERPGWRAN
jgi:hypothetical protein